MEKADPEEFNRLIHQLDRLQRQFEGLDGYGLEARIEKILPEMGFTIDDGNRLVSSFSGGWQMRMSLGKILLQTPDILLLDEPTNHLDLETIEWFRKIPQGFNHSDGHSVPRPGIPESPLYQNCRNGKGVSTTYLGNYSAYLQQKYEQQSAQLSAYERQQKELEKQQTFVRIGSGQFHPQYPSKKPGKTIRKGRKN